MKDSVRRHRKVCAMITHDDIARVRHHEHVSITGKLGKRHDRVLPPLHAPFPDAKSPYVSVVRW
jgi:hypothetical protein